MKRIAAILAVLALAASGAGSARSTAVPDYSDLWWNPAENGWGAHVTLQDEVVFAVLYVYDAQREPRFFVAPDMRRVDFAAFSGDTFAGALYATQGPAFAGGFDPSQVRTREVGTARLSFDTPGSGVLSYSVDGVTVTKAISRQAWRAPNLAGDYRGGLFATSTGSGCLFNLPSIAYAGALKLLQANAALTIEATVSAGFAESGTCRFTGRLAQQGSLAAVAGGTYACEFSNEIASSGTFDLSAIEAGENGFGGALVAREGTACVHRGHLGGVRRGYAEPAAPDP